MKILAPHYSDTIQLGDTTVDRLHLQQKILSEAFYLDLQSSFLASPFGKSGVTAAQTLAQLEGEKPTETRVILVNNASRAKHTDTGESKGSDCLWAQVEIGGVVHHIVGVDDDVFAFLAHSGRLKLGTAIKRIHGINYTLPDGNKIQIDDLSKGTQFRSKDHFPVVQCILLKELQKLGSLDDSQLKNIFQYGADFLGDSQVLTPQIRQKVADILKISQENLLQEDIDSYISEVGKTIGATIEKGGDLDNYHVDALQGYEGIQKVQLSGELHNFRAKFGFVPSGVDIEKEKLVDTAVLTRYHTARSKLSNDQLLVVDRDKYGNLICAPADTIFTIEEFIDQNVGFSLGDGDNYEILADGNVLCSVHLTKTISCKTGENCLWESSSRGPSGEKLFDINKSIGPDGEILREVQQLAKGTVLTVRRNFLKDLANPNKGQYIIHGASTEILLQTFTSTSRYANLIGKELYDRGKGVAIDTYFSELCDRASGVFCEKNNEDTLCHHETWAILLLHRSERQDEFDTLREKILWDDNQPWQIKSFVFRYSNDQLKDKYTRHLFGKNWIPLTQNVCDNLWVQGKMLNGFGDPEKVFREKGIFPRDENFFTRKDYILLIACALHFRKRGNQE